MDETALKPAMIDPRLTERLQSPVDILHVSQVAWLRLPILLLALGLAGALTSIGKDQRCS